MKYTDLNKQTFNRWVKEGWEWSIPISHEEYLEAQNGVYKIYLTPTKIVPNNWLDKIKGTKVLAFASGGGQQCPILTAMGCDVTCLDYSDGQLEKERMVAERENYEINLIEADYTQPLPFKDNEFDNIVAPVSLCYAKDIEPIFKELKRILKKDGYLLIGFDNGINYLFDENEEELIVKYSLPFDTLSDEKLYKYMMDNDYGIQFSHSLEETLGGLLKLNFVLLDIYEDYDREGKLVDKKILLYYSLLLKNA